MTPVDVCEQILLVDDNPQNLKILYETLDGQGYRLLLANTGEKALAIAEHSKPDLILLDIMMPGMDGYEVCETLKLANGLRDIPVVFLSALDDIDSKVKGFEKGGVDYIAKPFQPREVISRVATQIKLRRLEQELKEKNRELSADNIDMRQKLEAQREQLAHVSRLSTMGEMAAGFAHEVNQPLTAITNYSRVAHRLLAKLPGDALSDVNRADKKMLATTLDKLEAQSHRASEVIQRIRGFVKKPKAGKEALDIRALLADTVKFAEVDARNNKGTVVLSLPDALPIVEADAIQVQQVALNLIRNALEATSSLQQEGMPSDEDHTVHVKAYEDQELLWVEVIDHGCGLAPDAEERLFHPFYTTKGDGMGIGLSLCQSLIQGQGGKIGFRRNAGKGTTFFFSLPIS